MDQDLHQLKPLANALEWALLCFAAKPRSSVLIVTQARQVVQGDQNYWACSAGIASSASVLFTGGGPSPSQVHITTPRASNRINTIKRTARPVEVMAKRLF
jgi:hypothetical protein